MLAEATSHPEATLLSVLHLNVRILDDGKITDAQGREINFANTIIILTTNAGSERSNAVSGFSTDRQVQNEDRVEKALQKFLRPEFLNRIDEIITFRHLDVSDFAKIAEIMMRQLSDHLIEKGIKVTYTDAVLKIIAEKSYSEKYGARNMRRYIEKNVEDKIANIIIDSLPDKVYAIAMTSSKGEIKFDSM